MNNAQRSLENANVFSEGITELSNAFIENYMLLTRDKTIGNLWDFGLFKEIIELLTVQDFKVCRLEAETGLPAYFTI